MFSLITKDGKEIMLNERKCGGHIFRTRTFYLWLVQYITSCLIETSVILIVMASRVPVGLPQVVVQVQYNTR